jgi:DNA-binding transcriptional LysR family regulator
MDTFRLQQFCRVVETQSISKAAELCGITKSGISRSLGLLQQEVGIVLMSTEGRRVRINAAGIEFYHKAIEILKKISELKQVNRSGVSLTLGAQEIFTFNLLPLILSQTKFNGLSDLVLLDLPDRELENAISSGKILWGISYTPAPFLNIEHLPIAKFSVGVFATSTFIEKLHSGKGLSFVLPFEGPPLSPFEVKKMQKWEMLTRTLKKTLTVNRLSTGLALAQLSQAAIFLPDFFVKISNQNTSTETKLFKIDDLKLPKIERTVYLVKKAGDEESKEIRALCAGIRRHVP